MAFPILTPVFNSELNHSTVYNQNLLFLRAYQHITNINLFCRIPLWLDKRPRVFIPQIVTKSPLPNMCSQTHVRYLCGCPQSTRTNACRGSLTAAKRGLPHKVTTTEQCLNEYCPWGCRISAFVNGVNGKLEAHPEETTVSIIPPPPVPVVRGSSVSSAGNVEVEPPPVPVFRGSSVSSAGNVEVAQDSRSRTASADGNEAPSIDWKSLTIKLCYPSDIQCSVSDRIECYRTDDDAAATGEDAKPEEEQLSIVMQHNRKKNRSLRAA